MTHYNGTPLSTLSFWELGQLEKTIKEAEAKREEASKHPKFDKKKLTLPPPNPNFIILKNAVEAEIKERQKNV